MSEADIHEELLEIAASVHALTEWYAITGARELLCETPADEVLGWFSQHPAAPSAEKPRRAAQAPAPAPFKKPEPEAHRAPAPAPPAAPAPRPPALQPPAFAAQTPAFTPPQRPPAAAPLHGAAAPPIDFGIPAPAKPRPETISLFGSSELAAPGAPAPIGVVVTGQESPEERRIKLSVLADEVRECKRCGLCAERTNTVFARGNPMAELCFVGEGPGADEDAQGFPFVGKAGQLLDKMIGAMGYARDDVYICNIVKCRPPDNRTPEPNEMSACIPFLTAQLALIQPKVIVALGATAVRGLTGISEGITRQRGRWKLYKGTTPIMPTFHPAYLLRNPAAKREVWNDLQEVMRLLGKSVPGKGA